MDLSYIYVSLEYDIVSTQHINEKQRLCTILAKHDLTK
jgi:hypothetical protein